MHTKRDELSIAMLQSDIIWEQPLENIRKIEGFLKEASENSAQALFLPEMFTTGFSVDSVYLAESLHGESVSRMKELSLRYNMYIGGSMIINENKENFNRLLWFAPDLTIDYYDKKHLFTMGGENTHFKAGSTIKNVNCHGWKIRLAVCYDLRFPSWLRNKYVNGIYDYDILFISANWPASRAYQWKQLLIARAIENQSYVIAINRCGKDGRDYIYSGGSMLIGPTGEIIHECGETEEITYQTLSIPMLYKIREKFPFAEDWDNITILEK